MKRLLFKKLIGVCLAVTLAAGNMVVSEENTVVAHAKATYLYEETDPYGNYCNYYRVYPRTYTNYIDYLEDVAKNIHYIDSLLGKKIAVSDLDSYSKSLGGAYKNIDVNAYESILCLLRTDTEPQKIKAYLIGYRSNGTKELICKDNGYDFFGCNKDGYYEDGSDFQGYDSEGYGLEDGINREGIDREGYTRSGIPTLTNGVSKSGNIYYYNDDEVKPLSFKLRTRRHIEASGVAFKNNNTGYYKVTMSGLKKSKMIGVFTRVEEGESKTLIVGQELSPMDDRYAEIGDDKYGYPRKMGLMLSQYAVKNGKVTFYAKANTDTFTTHMNQEVSGITWKYINSKNEYIAENNVSVKITPVTKADIKKSTTLSAKSTLVVTSKKSPDFVDLTFNEPLFIDGADVPSSAMFSNQMTVNLNTKTSKIRLVWDDVKDMYGEKNTIIIKGRYSGKIIKVKVVNKVK